LADGGLWANNPALAAVIDAQYRLGQPLTNLKVLSIGTGLSRPSYGTQVNGKGWGLLNGWRNKEFIGFLMSLQGQSTQNYLQLMLGENQLLRLSFDSEVPLPLDDHRQIDDLMSRADREFTHKSDVIRRFLN